VKLVACNFYQKAGNPFAPPGMQDFTMKCCAISRTGKILQAGWGKVLQLLQNALMAPLLRTVRGKRAGN
jgi:hypothetical protein